MTREHEADITGTAGDYGYDMAHDFEPSAARASGGEAAKHRPVYVPTETSDTQEDLGYDLSHDVPSRRAD